MTEHVKWDFASKTHFINSMVIILPLISVKLGWVTKENITAILTLLDCSQTELTYLAMSLLAAVNMVLRKVTSAKTSLLPKWLRDKRNAVR